MRCSPKTLVTILAAAALAGCVSQNDIYSGGTGLHAANSEAPIAANFRASHQLKLQAAEHWRRAAEDAAGALDKSLRKGAPLYLRRSCETTGCAPQACDTPFNRIFFNEFLTALVGRGHAVTLAPAAGAATVELDLQPIAFASNRPQYRYAGVPVEIGPGVWALGDVATLLDAGGNAAPRTDGSWNWYRTEFAGGATPRGEVVVTASVMSPERAYVARDTRIYYVADADAGLYSCLAPTPSGRSTFVIPVVGDCTAPRCEQAPDRRR